MQVLVTREHAVLVCRQEASFILSPSHDARLLDRQLATLKATGATGIMLDVWCAQPSSAHTTHRPRYPARLEWPEAPLCQALQLLYGDRQQDQCGQVLRLRVICRYLPDISSDMENLRRRWGICERRGPREYDFSAYMEVRQSPGAARHQRAG